MPYYKSKRWSKKEEQQLLTEINNKVEVSIIAIDHDRSENAIKTRLAGILVRMRDEDGMTEDEICEKMGINSAEFNTYINSGKTYVDSNKTINSSTQSTSLTLLPINTETNTVIEEVITKTHCKKPIKDDPIITTKIISIIDEKVKDLHRKNLDDIINKRVNYIIGENLEPIVHTNLNMILDKHLNKIVDDKLEEIIKNKIEPIIISKTTEIINEKLSILLE
tara:strand:- start:197 stop:862 length:666 start_codon:yes stop_codon:yes gene_type:complete